MDDQVSLSGELTQLRSNFGGDWGFGTLMTTNKKVAIVGTFSGIAQGMFVTVTGTWDEHPKYGKQLKVSSIAQDIPSTTIGIKFWLIQYLPRIGEIRAGALVDQYGVGLWNIIEKDPDQLIGVKGLTKANVEQICDAYHRCLAERDVRVSLYTIGYTQGEATLLITAYGIDAGLKEIPPHLYHLTKPWFGFRRMEVVHAKGGWDLNEPTRMTSGIVEGVRAASQDGHTLLGIKDIERYAGDLLSTEDTEGVREAFYKLVASENPSIVALGGNQYMLWSLYDAERSVGATTIALLRAQQRKQE